MIKKYYIYIAIVIIAITTIMLINTNKDSNYSNGALEIENTAWDFGITNMREGKVSHKFKLVNNSGNSVNIEKIYTSCGCTSAYIIEDNGERSAEFGMQGHGLEIKADVKVDALGFIILEVVFDPEAHGPDAIGKIKRLIYIETNSKIKPKITLEISADVINEEISNLLPKAETNITEYDFGKILKEDGIASTDFIINNSGKADLIIGDITTSCGCTSAKIDKTTVAPKDNAIVTVSFDPNFHKEPEGEFSRSIFIPTNDPNNKEIEFKISVELN